MHSTHSIHLTSRLSKQWKIQVIQDHHLKSDSFTLKNFVSHKDKRPVFLQFLAPIVKFVVEAVCVMKGVSPDRKPDPENKAKLIDDYWTPGT